MQLSCHSCSLIPRPRIKCNWPYHEYVSFPFLSLPWYFVRTYLAWASGLDHLYCILPVPEIILNLHGFPWISTLVHVVTHSMVRTGSPFSKHTRDSVMLPSNFINFFGTPEWFVENRYYIFCFIACHWFSTSSIPWRPFTYYPNFIQLHFIHGMLNIKLKPLTFYVTTIEHKIKTPFIFAR